MKKELMTIFVSSILVSCGGGDANTAKQQESQQESGVEQEHSAQNQESQETSDSELDSPESEDHYAIWQMDSTNEVNFKTSHLMVMELCGHVKKVTWNQEKIEFDEQGRIVKYDDGQGELQVMGELDEANISFYAPGAASSYEIDMQHKRVATNSGGEYAYYWENKYIYDASGKLVAIEESETEEEKTTVNKRNVTILEEDHHGNWLKRKVGSREESRTIQYYDNPIGGEEASFDPMSSAIQLKGSIGGDANCDFSLCGGKGEYKNSYGVRSTKAVSFSSDQLKVEAYDKQNNLIGCFEGTFKSDPSHISYKGVFVNSKTGGKVNFDLENR